MQQRLLDFLQGAAVWVMIFFQFGALPAQAAVDQDRVNALILKASTEGPVPIIVGIKTGVFRGGRVSGEQKQDRQDTFRLVQSGLIERIRSSGAYLENIKTFQQVVPYVAIMTDAKGIRTLAADSRVESIEEDIAVPASLVSSIPVMDFDDAHILGKIGSGQVVAILDTGVSKSHSWFQSRVISEACYSSDVESQSATSLCPNGDLSSTGPDSGLNCSLSIPGCDHGTHVAGIAAGDNLNTDGAAPGANIISIQIFSRFDDRAAAMTMCADAGLPSPCVLSYTSDQIAGLARIDELSDTYNIASVNMSLGGGRVSGDCDSDSRKSIIDDLRAKNIATVVAAGNNDFKNAMNAPACISSTISVCSTTDYDNFSSFTNVSDSTDVCAIGSNVVSSVVADDFATDKKSGTSMATPFVTGLIALLKQNGCETVDEIEQAIEDTGVLITDNRSGGIHTKPRIDADDALAVCKSSPEPVDDDSLCFPIKARNGRIAVICL